MAKLREIGSALPRLVGPEDRRRAGQTLSKTRLGWLPQEWRPRYLSLRSYHGAAEAKRLVLAEIAAAEASAIAERDRHLAKLTPFERTLARVRAGAPVVMKPRMPTRTHDFTLGGVSAGML